MKRTVKEEISFTPIKNLTAGGIATLKGESNKDTSRTDSKITKAESNAKNSESKTSVSFKLVIFTYMKSAAYEMNYGIMHCIIDENTKF